MTDLPGGWAGATMTEVSSDSGYGTSAKCGYEELGIGVLRIPNIQKGSIDLADLKRAPTSLEVNDHLRLRADDLLLVRTNGSQDLIGRCAPVTQDLECSFASYLIRFRMRSEVVDTRFVSWMLSSPTWRQRLEAAAASSAGQYNLSLRTLGPLPVVVPPLAEQERIVAAIEEAFSKLDAGEAGLRTLRQLLKRMRDAILAAAVTGHLVPQDPTDTPASKLLADLGVEAIVTGAVTALPDGWAWAALGSISESVRNGIFVSRPPETPPGVPILRIGAVRRLELDLTDVRFARVDVADPAVARALLLSGDLLFTRYNGNPAFVGACAVVPEIDSPLLHPDKLIRVVVNRAVAEPTFVATAAAAGASRSFIEGVTKTTAGQAGISGSDLRLVPIPLAPVEEQRRIVSEVERQFSFLDACERAVDTGLARAAATRRSVLKAAFEGRLVPQEPSDEPASVSLQRIRAERAAAPKAARRSRRTA